MKSFIVPCLALALCACAGLPVPQQTAPYFSDELFDAPAQLVSASEALQPSRNMREYLAGRIAGLARSRGPRLALIEAISDDLKIEYDSKMTRNAAQAFEARSGNCLSLALMTASLARELDIPVTYQQVLGQDTWSRSGDLAFRSGHINLVLGARGTGRWVRGEAGDAMTVDFLPPPLATRLFSLPVSESVVVAMYLNNRAAETLAGGDLDQAYWYARESMRIAPTYIGAYNTLGVIYRRHGNPEQAEKVLAYALQREPGNAQVLSNLAMLRASRGDEAGARELRERLARIAPFPPYYYFDRGMAALKRGDNQGAVSEFRKELARMPYDDKLHFLIAVASMQLGEMKEAQRQMTLAVENSTTREQQAIYAGKLNHLKQLSN